jgi:hypothetical protein
MPTFEFTSPDGKSYSIEGPAGSTKEQAFSILQTQLANKAQEPQPEATQQPAQQAKQTPKERLQSIIQGENPLNKLKPDDTPAPHPTLQSAVENIAGSGAAGALIGAASPELLTGAGVVANAIPGVGPEVGAFLTTAGTVARANRWGAAASGLMSGLASEGAGQAAEAAGASKSTANTVRLAAGAATPVVNYVPKILKPAWTAVQRLVGMEDAGTPAAVATARENLAKAAENGVPQHQMHSMLQAGVEADRKAAEQAADAVVQKSIGEANKIAQSDAKTAAKIVDDGRQRADAIRAEHNARAAKMDAVAGDKLNTANRILAQAEPELAKVGPQVNPSDLGNQLRDAAAAKQGAALQARNEQYRALQAERDAVVQAKEAAGDTIDKLPEMKELKAEIGKYTLSNKAGREAAGGMAKATDPGVLKAYQQVEDAISNRRVQVGVDPETGNPKFQTFRTSFEAIDAVRRRLGEAGKGDAEGYDALGKQIANKLYQRLSNIQEKFVGEQGGRNLQREMQSGYAEATEATKGFGTASGKKLTAVDRVDPEKFAADPQGLPKYFFKSQQSVRDAVELTGSRELVNQAASSHAAGELQGMSSKQVKQWAAKNNDWTREVPGLNKKVSDYADKLAQIERVNDKLGSRATTATKTAEAERTTGNKLADQELVEARKQASRAAEGSVATQDRILKQGQDESKETFKQQFGPSERLQSDLRSGEAPEAVRGLLLKGKPEQTRLAAAHLANMPGGQKVLEDSVRQSLRNMGEKNLTQTWHERVLPMLREGKMIPPERLQALESDVNRILQAYKGKDKLSLVQRHVIAAIASAANATAMKNN